MHDLLMSHDNIGSDSRILSPITVGHQYTAPTILDRGVDVMLLSYSSYILPGKLSQPPYQNLLKVINVQDGWHSLSIKIAGSVFPITPRRCSREIESSHGKVFYVMNDSRPLVNIFVRHDRGLYKPDVFVRLHPALFDWVGDKPAVESIRSWIHRYLYTDLTHTELLSIERVSRVDLKTDILIPSDSKYDLLPDAGKHITGRLKRRPIYIDSTSGRLTGLAVGDGRNCRIHMYDKAQEVISK